MDASGLCLEPDLNSRDRSQKSGQLPLIDLGKMDLWLEEKFQDSSLLVDVDLKSSSRFPFPSVMRVRALSSTSLTGAYSRHTTLQNAPWTQIRDLPPVFPVSAIAAMAVTLFLRTVLAAILYCLRKTIMAVRRIKICPGSTSCGLSTLYSVFM